MDKLYSGDQQNDLSEVFYPRQDFVCTEAFSAFLTEYRSHINYFLFVVRLASDADKARIATSRALAIISDDPEKKLKFEKSAAIPDATVKALQRFSTVSSQYLTNGIVNAFQRYFSSLIQSVALKRPQIMTSAKDQIRVDEVLRFTRHRDLVTFIIDRKINSLSYGGLDELERYFDDRLNVRMFQDDRQKALMRLFIEARNINVHNRGQVNDVFIQRVGEVEGFPYKEGRIFHIDFDSLITLSENAMVVAQSMDTRVREKFDLRKKALSVWHGKKGGTKPPSLSPTN